MIEISYFPYFYKTHANFKQIFTGFENNFVEPVLH